MPLIKNTIVISVLSSFCHQGRSTSLNGFHRIARNTMFMFFKEKDDPSPEVVEVSREKANLDFGILVFVTFWVPGVNTA